MQQLHQGLSKNVPRLASSAVGWEDSLLHAPGALSARPAQRASLSELMKRKM